MSYIQRSNIIHFFVSCELCSVISYGKIAALYLGRLISPSSHCGLMLLDAVVSKSVRFEVLTTLTESEGCFLL